MSAPKARRPRGPKPETTYRCQNLEALMRCFQNELESNSQSIIPETDSAQFVFYNDAMIRLSTTASSTGKDKPAPPRPADGDSDTVISLEEALYRTIEPKAKVKTQRVVARSIMEVFQGVDGFKYTERMAYSADDGTRFKLVCVDSLQNRDRVANGGARNPAPSGERKPHAQKPTYDCGGSILITFSMKRECITVVYRHNPIHGVYPTQEQNGYQPPNVFTSDTIGSDSMLPSLESLPLAIVSQPTSTPKGRANPAKTSALESTEASPAKKRRKKRTSAVTQDEIMDAEPAFPVPVTLRPNSSPWLLQNTASAFGDVQNNDPTASTSSTPQPPPNAVSQEKIKRKRVKTGCASCREKKVKCDEGKPSCGKCTKRSRICSYSG